MKRERGSVSADVWGYRSLAVFVVVATGSIYISGCSEHYRPWAVYHLYPGPERALEEVAIVIDKSHSPVEITRVDNYIIDFIREGPEYHILPGRHFIRASLDYSFRNTELWSTNGYYKNYEDGDPVDLFPRFQKGHVYVLDFETEYPPEVPSEPPPGMIFDEEDKFDLSGSLILMALEQLQPEPKDKEGKWWVKVIDKGTVQQVASQVTGSKFAREFARGRTAPRHWRELAKKKPTIKSGTQQKTEQFIAQAGKVRLTVKYHEDTPIWTYTDWSSGLSDTRIPLDLPRIDIRPAQPDIRMPDMKLPPPHIWSPRLR